MGPINPDLYETHRGVFTIAGAANPDVVDGEQQESITAVLSTYTSWKDYQLPGLVKQEQPWQDAWGDTKPGSRGNIISEKTMLEFYSSLDGSSENREDETGGQK